MAPSLFIVVIFTTVFGLLGEELGGVDTALDGPAASLLADAVLVTVRVGAAPPPPELHAARVSPRAATATGTTASRARTRHGRADGPET